MSSTVDNAFKYLSDVDESSTESNIIVNGIVDYNSSPHKNKKAYDIHMVYTPGTQNYNSKIGINIYPLDVGKYTLIMEYYFPEDLNISIFAQASKPATIIKKQITISESDMKKKLVQFDFTEKANPSYYLFFTIIGTGTTSTNPEGYLVFYGVKGWDDAIPPELYDHALETGMFEYDNGNMKMYNDIDMNNHKIKNIPSPANPTDLLMKKSIKIYYITQTGQINSQGFFAVDGAALKFNNVFIKHITIVNLSGVQQQQDTLMIRTEGLGYTGPLSYPFSYRQSMIINFSINIKAPKVQYIRVKNGKSMPYVIDLVPIDIV